MKNERWYPSFILHKKTINLRGLIHGAYPEDEKKLEQIK